MPVLFLEGGGLFVFFFLFVFWFLLFRGLASFFVVPAVTLLCIVSHLAFVLEAKPGGFQTGGFPTFFGKGPDCVADPFGTVPRRCC